MGRRSMFFPGITHFVSSEYSLELGQIKEAEEVLRRASEISPKNIRATFNFAVALYKLDRIQEADYCGSVIYSNFLFKVMTRNLLSAHPKVAC